MTDNARQAVSPETQQRGAAAAFMIRLVRNVGILGMTAAARVSSAIKKPAVLLASSSALLGSAATLGVMKLNGDFVRTPDKYRPAIGEVLPEYKLDLGRRLSFPSSYSRNRDDVSITIDLKNRTIEEDVAAREHGFRPRLIYRRSSALKLGESTATHSWERKNEKRLTRIFEAIAEPATLMWGYHFDDYKVVCQKSQYDADVTCSRVLRNG